MRRSLAFVVPGDLASRTGGYGYDREIIAGLRAQAFDVTVIQLDPGFPHPTDAALAHAREVFSALPDGTTVVVDGLAFGAMPALAEAEARRLKLVALVHHPLAFETGLDPALVSVLRESERRALATARAVIVTSAGTAHQLGDFGVSAASAAVVEPGTKPAPLATGSGSGAMSLLCVATLTPRKGHDVLFAALSSLRDHEWRLSCVGSSPPDDPTAERLRVRLDRLRLADRVQFSAGGDDCAVAAAYATADVFVLPTRYEGYGMVVAEALACGLPVISTDTGAIASLVGSHAGLVVPPGDVAAFERALERLFVEPALLPRLRAGARAVRERLPRWEDSVAKFAAVLETVAAS